MEVSDDIFQTFAGFGFIAEEARKKRAFFPEDIVDSNILFHLCLLSRFDHRLLTLDHKRSSMVCGPLSNKNKNPFIHIRDEGLLRGTTRIVGRD
jgi:hypothetical protein